MTNYRGVEILDHRADRDFSASEEAPAFNAVLESKAGVFAVFCATRRKLWTRGFLWTCRNRAELVELETFLALRYGRFAPYWVPTWVMDFDLTAPASAGDKAIVVKKSDFDPARTHVAVITPTTVEPFMIQGVVDNMDGTMTLRLWHDVTDPGLSVDIAPPNVMVSLLKFVRLSDDSVPITFSAGGIAETNLAQAEIPYEAP